MTAFLEEYQRIKCVDSQTVYSVLWYNTQFFNYDTNFNFFNGNFSWQPH